MAEDLDYIDEYAGYCAQLDFDVSKEEGFGKFPVAKRDLKIGEVLVEELPLVWWADPTTVRDAKEGKLAFCEACFKKVEENTAGKVAGWSCGEDCAASLSGRSWFPHLETVRGWQADKSPGHAVTAEALLKCLGNMLDRMASLRAGNPEVEPAVVYHSAIRPFTRLVAPAVAEFEAAVKVEEMVELLQGCLKLKVEEVMGAEIAETFLSKESVSMLLGQLVLNSQAVLPKGGTPARKGAATFVLQSLFNHSCEPCVEVVFTDSCEIALTVCADVEAGQPLNIGYIDTTMPYAKREQALSNYFFKCNCPRCVRERPASGEGGAGSAA